VKKSPKTHQLPTKGYHKGGKEGKQGRGKVEMEGMSKGGMEVAKDREGGEGWGRSGKRVGEGEGKRGESRQSWCRKKLQPELWRLLMGTSREKEGISKKGKRSENRKDTERKPYHGNGKTKKKGELEGQKIWR